MTRRKQTDRETAWTSCEDAGRLLLLDMGPVGTLTSRRKAQLFAAACVRRVEAVVPHKLLARFARAIAVAEQFADGTATEAQLNRERRGLMTAYAPLDLTEPEESAREAARDMLSTDYADWLAAVVYSAEAVAPSVRARRSRPTDPPGGPFERAAQVAIMHDTFGNPFRPVVFDPVWRSNTAVSLAGRMYESRDFSLIPILADALQDAGCETAEVLGHCRDPGGTHVRGCWVVDLVLGKQ